MTSAKQLAFERHSQASKKGWERRRQRQREKEETEREAYLAKRQKASIQAAAELRAIFDAYNARFVK